MNWYELLLMIGTWGILGAACLYVTCQLFGGRQLFSLAFGVYLGGFLLRALLILLNQEIQFFDNKGADSWSLGLYEEFVLYGHSWIGLLQEEFAPQVFLNIPIWLIYGPSTESILMSNATIGALAAPIAAVLLYRDFGDVCSKRALVLLSLYPGGFNFSLFGLRDPIIFLSVMVMVIGGMRIWMSGSRPSNFVLVASGAFITLWSRPELAYVVLVFFLIPIMNSYINILVNSLNSRKAMSSLMLLTIPVLLIGAGAVAMATRVAAQNIGARTMNPAEIAETKAVSRFERHDVNTGGGSHIVSAAVYNRLPWYLRVPLQTSGLIMLPFPWKVTSVTRLMAFGDSLFLIGLILFAAINLFYSHPLRTVGIGRLIFFLLLVALVGFVGLGFVISNFGNGFRMRLAITPLIFLSAAVCPIRVRFRLSKSRHRRASLAQPC